MFRRGVVAGSCAVLAVGLFVALAGCDWFQSSDPALRSSPRISNLSVQPSSVLCGQEFMISFHYEDPQGDIANARITLQLSGSATTREETPFWPDTASRSSGTVSFPYSFTPKPCSGLGGTWAITVQAQDDQGNGSNTLTSQVILSSAG